MQTANEVGWSGAFQCMSLPQSLNTAETTGHDGKGCLERHVPLLLVSIPILPSSANQKRSSQAEWRHKMVAILVCACYDLLVSTCSDSGPGPALIS